MRARLKDEEKALRQAEGDVVDAIAEQIASGRRGVPSAEAYLSGTEPGALLLGRRPTTVRLGIGLAKLANNYYFTNFLVGSFSAVSKRNFAIEYAFDSIFKFYKMCTLLHRSKLNIIARHWLKKSAIFVKFQQI